MATTLFEKVPLVQENGTRHESSLNDLSDFACFGGAWRRQYTTREGVSSLFRGTLVQNTIFTAEAQRWLFFYLAVRGRQIKTLVHARTCILDASIGHWQCMKMYSRRVSVYDPIVTCLR
jgi:hypothetical protein